MIRDKQLPNVFTCLNLLCGCIAIVSVFHGNVILLSGMMFLAALFDLADGLTARSLNAYSELGKQLDSLADMVTFGAAPGMIMYNMMIRNAEQQIFGSEFLFSILKYFPFVITVFAAFRLAKFNIDKRQTNSFLGLPTPAVGIFVTSFPLIAKYDSWHLEPLLINPYFILAISLGLAYLMVSEIPLFAFKFKTLSWNENKIQFVFLLLSLILILVLHVAAIPLLIVLYIILSLVNNYFLKQATA